MYHLSVESRSVGQPGTAAPAVCRAGQTGVVAFVSDDGTVFIQTLENGDLNLRFACAIDLPHDELPSSRAPLSPRPQLTWLGGAAQYLAISRHASVFLVTVDRPPQPQAAGNAAGPGAHLWHLRAHIHAEAAVTCVTGPPDAGFLCVASSSGGVACYAPHAQPQTAAGGPEAWRVVWNARAAAPQVTAASNSVAGRAVCASASASEPAVTVWTFPHPNSAPLASRTFPAQQRLRLPAPVLSVDFSPAPCAPHSAQERPVLLVAARDGVIRLFVDGESAAAAPGARASSRYCLVHMLQPPSAMLAVHGTLLKASWAQSSRERSEEAASSSCATYLLWLVALVYNPAVAAAQHPVCPARLEYSDEVYVWAVDLRGKSLPHLPGGSAELCASASSPCFCVLWGASCTQATWQDPVALCRDGRRACGPHVGLPPTHLTQHVAVVTHHECPRLLLSHVAVNVSTKHGEARCLALDPIDVAASPDQAFVLQSARLLRRLSAHDVTCCPLAPPRMPTLVHVEVNEALLVCASVDADGGVALWHAQPVKLFADYHALTALLDTPVLAVAWLAPPPPARPDEPHQGAAVCARLAICAAAEHGLTLAVVELELQASGGAAADSVAATRLLCSCLVPADAVSTSPRPTLAACAAPGTSDLDLVLHFRGGARGWGVDTPRSLTARVLRFANDERTGPQLRCTLTPLRHDGDARWDVLATVAGKADLLLGCAPGCRPQFLRVADGLLTPVSPPSREPGPHDGPAPPAVLSASAHWQARVAASVLSPADGPRDSEQTELAIWDVLSTGVAVVARRAHRVTGGRHSAVRVLCLGGVHPAVAVAAGGALQLWLRCGGVWCRATSTPIGGGAVSCLPVCGGAPLVASSGQLVRYQLALQLGARSVPVAAVAQAAAPPLPVWHPLVVSALLHRGWHRAAAAVARELLAVLKGVRDAPPDVARVCELLCAPGELDASTAAAFWRALTAAGAGRRVAPPQSTPSASKAASADAPAPSGLSAILKKPRQLPASGALTLGLADRPGARPHALPVAPGDGVASGMLDMSAFGFGGAGVAAPTAAKPPPPPPATDSLSSGMLDMSAFGFGGARGAASSAAKPPPPPPPAADSLSSGMLDMSAFGFGGAGEAVQTVAKPPSPQRPATDSLSSGMLDMSAFGFGGAGAAVQTVAKPPSPQPPATDSLSSGMLDMSAFGFGGAGGAAPTAAKPPPPQPPATDSLSSGMLDMSAFGFGGAGGAAQTAAKSPPPATDSLSSGMLDMSAFGFAGAAAAVPPLPRRPSSTTLIWSPDDAGESSAFSASAPKSGASVKYPPSPLRAATGRPPSGLPDSSPSSPTGAGAAARRSDALQAATTARPVLFASGGLDVAPLSAQARRNERQSADGAPKAAAIEPLPKRSNSFMALWESLVGTTDAGDDEDGGPVAEGVHDSDLELDCSYFGVPDELSRSDEAGARCAAAGQTPWRAPRCPSFFETEQLSDAALYADTARCSACGGGDCECRACGSRVRSHAVDTPLAAFDTPDRTFSLESASWRLESGILVDPCDASDSASGCDSIASGCEGDSMAELDLFLEGVTMPDCDDLQACAVSARCPGELDNIPFESAGAAAPTHSGAGTRDPSSMRHQWRSAAKPHCSASPGGGGTQPRASPPPPRCTEAPTADAQSHALPIRRYVREDGRIIYLVCPSSPSGDGRSIHLAYPFMPADATASRPVPSPSSSGPSTPSLEPDDLAGFATTSTVPEADAALLSRIRSQDVRCLESHGMLSTASVLRSVSYALGSTYDSLADVVMPYSHDRTSVEGRACLHTGDSSYPCSQCGAISPHAFVSTASTCATARRSAVRRDVASFRADCGASLRDAAWGPPSARDASAPSALPPRLSDRPPANPALWRCPPLDRMSGEGGAALLRRRSGSKESASREGARFSVSGAKARVDRPPRAAGAALRGGRAGEALGGASTLVGGQSGGENAAACGPAGAGSCAGVAADRDSGVCARAGDVRGSCAGRDERSSDAAVPSQPGDSQPAPPQQSAAPEPGGGEPGDVTGCSTRVHMGLELVEACLHNCEALAASLRLTDAPEASQNAAPAAPPAKPAPCGADYASQMMSSRFSLALTEDSVPTSSDIGPLQECSGASWDAAKGPLRAARLVQLLEARSEAVRAAVRASARAAKARRERTPPRVCANELPGDVSALPAPTVASLTAAGVRHVALLAERPSAASGAAALGCHVARRPVSGARPPLLPVIKSGTDATCSLVGGSCTSVTAESAGAASPEAPAPRTRAKRRLTDAIRRLSVDLARRVKLRCSLESGAARLEAEASPARVDSSTPMQSRTGSELSEKHPARTPPTRSHPSLPELEDEPAQGRCERCLTPPPHRRNCERGGRASSRPWALAWRLALPRLGCIGFARRRPCEAAAPVCEGIASESSWESETAGGARPFAAMLERAAAAELHHCPEDDLLTRGEVDALNALLDPAHWDDARAAAADEPRSAAALSGLVRDEAALLLALLPLVAQADAAELTPLQRAATAAAAATSTRGLDAPGKRMLSAVRVAAALSEHERQQEAAAAAAGAARGPGPKPKALSRDAQALLQRLTGAAAPAPGGGGMQRVASVASCVSEESAPAGKEREWSRGPSVANLSALSSGGLQAAAVDAVEPLSAKLHLLPGLQGLSVCWALSAGSPTVLLEACMPFMPPREAAEGSRTAASTSSGFGAAVRAGGGMGNPWTWRNLRRIGAALWLQEPQAVLDTMERTARAMFASDRDAAAVALWYCAMGKRSALAVMFRSIGEPKVAAFLARDFAQDGHRVAAAKNAHALLSQHKHALAAAFFVLAADAAAAVDVCLDELKDAQMALMLCRLLDASGSIPAGGESHTTRLLTRLLASPGAAADPAASALLTWTLEGGQPALQRLSGVEPWRPTTHGPPDAAQAPPGLAALLSLQAYDFLLSALATHARDDTLPIDGSTAAGTLGSWAAAASLELSLAGAHAVAAPLLGAVASIAATASGAEAGCDARHLAALTLSRCVALSAAASAAQPLSGSDGVWRDARKVASSLRADFREPPTARLLPDLPAAPRVGNVAVARLCGYQCADEADAARVRGTAALVDAARVQLVLDELRDACAPSSDDATADAPPQTPREPVRDGTAGHAASTHDASGASPLILRPQDARIVAVVAERDAQDVVSCSPYAMLAPDDLNIAVTTKKSGVVLAREADALQSPKGDGSLFGYVYNQIVDDWNLTGDDVVLDTEFTVAGDMVGPVQRLSLVQHAQRTANIAPKPGACVAQAAAAHPLQPYLLTGSAPGYLHMWAFGSGRLRVTYAPLPFSHHLLGAAGDVPQPSRVSHWGYAAAIAFSDSGSRFAAVGKGGWTAVWRQDARWAATPHGQVGCCDWGHHCIAKNGAGVAFVGASSSVIAVGGGGAHRQHVAVWDTMVPLPSACVATLACGAAKQVNALTVLPGGLTLVAGLANGALCAFDLRMLGAGKGAEPLWVADAAHAGGVSCLAACPMTLRPGGLAGELLASGGRDGRVLLWDAAGRQLQALPLLHWTPARTYFAFGHGSEDRVAAKVKSVAFHSSGLLSCGHNSRVLLTPWAAA